MIVNLIIKKTLKILKKKIKIIKKKLKIKMRKKNLKKHQIQIQIQTMKEEGILLPIFDFLKF